MASLSTCRLGLWLGWQILLNLNIDPHIIGITESGANKDIADAKLELTGYAMVRRDLMGRRGGEVILYIKEYIHAYELKLEREVDCDEAGWCNTVTGNSTLTFVYRRPYIKEEKYKTL